MLGVEETGTHMVTESANQKLPIEVKSANICAHPLNNPFFEH